MHDLEKQWQKRFSETAGKETDDAALSIVSKVAMNGYIKYFLSYFKPYLRKDNSKRRVLDLGCGSGTFSRIIADYNFEVYGIDYSEEMIAVARKKSDNEKIIYSLGDAYNSRFTSEKFDIIVCMGVFQSLSDPGKGLREINRLLPADGVAIITTLNKFSIFSLISPFRKISYTPLNRYNPFELKSLMKRNGFNDIKIKGMFIIPFNFITNFIIKLKIYNFFNLLFPISMIFSHSFYIEGRKS